MGRTHNDMQELLGAYALNALEPDEIESLELHLTDCPKCRAELRDHRETAAMLAHVGETAPTGLWDRIVASLDDVPEDADTVFRLPIGLSGNATEKRRFTGARWRKAAFAAAAAAAAIVAVDTAVIVRNHDSTPSVADAATIAMRNPTSKLISLASADKSQSIDVVLTADGHGYVFRSTLTQLESSKTYQLWGLVDGKAPVSLGVLGRAPKAVAFAADLKLNQLAITVEKAGGAQLPTQLPLMSGDVA